MKRLLPAALIALACHGLLFLLQPLETQPPRLKAARRPVNLNLAHFVPAAPVVQKEQPILTPPKVAPPLQNLNQIQNHQSPGLNLNPG